MYTPGGKILVQNVELCYDSIFWEGTKFVFSFGGSNYSIHRPFLKNEKTWRFYPCSFTYTLCDVCLRSISPKTQTILGG